MEMKLSDELVRMAGDFANKLIDELRSPSSRASAMSARLSSHGAEGNFDLQADAKAAEVAFCLWVGLDPLSAVKWTVGPDIGWDVELKGSRIDVKHTYYENGRLIWPIHKNHLLSDKNFFLFALMVGSRRTSFKVRGWVTRKKFLSVHRTAGENYSDKLTPGTWFMEASELWAPSTFSESVEFFEAERRRQKGTFVR